MNPYGGWSWQVAKMAWRLRCWINRWIVGAPELGPKQSAVLWRVQKYFLRKAIRKSRVGSDSGSGLEMGKETGGRVTR